MIRFWGFVAFVLFCLSYKIEDAAEWCRSRAFNLEFERKWGVK